MKELFRNWSGMRIFRLVVGLALSIYVIISKDYAFLLFGLFFLIQAILNASCCGVQRCDTKKPEKEVGIYENQIKPLNK